MELSFLYLVIFLVSIIQSIAGVGILVLGTPLMLILNYSIVEAMFFLLPLSIISSFLNMISFNFFFQINDKIDKNLIKYFFLYCFPSICFGVFIIKHFNESINFNILVSVIILFSVIIRLRFERIFLKLKVRSKKIITILIGLIHGLTNSGGTLISLFILNKKKKLVDQSRYEIHLFYFLLATTQLIILYYLMKDEFQLNVNLIIIIMIMFVTSLIGNKLSKKFKNISLYLIYCLAILSSIVLLLKDVLFE